MSSTATRSADIRLIQDQSTWLQKALFALQKADVAHGKLADSRGEDRGPYVLKTDDTEISMEAIEGALEERIQELLTTTREARKAVR